MGASQLLRRFFLLVVLLVGVLVFLFRKWKASQKGRYQWDRFKLKVKVFGPLQLLRRRLQGGGRAASR